MTPPPELHPAQDARAWFTGRREVTLAAESKPHLLVLVDTEEEFDWNGGFDRSNTSVAAMEHIGGFQGICDSFGIQPTYLVDYPVVSQEQGRRDLLAFFRSGRAQIGAHLHPWVSPPFEEEVTVHNSYPGNLERRLEFEKLKQLTEAIEQQFGARPQVYKAGRYGFGPNTAEILSELSYTVDLSASPPRGFSDDGGPDYTHFSSRPYWFGKELLGLPLTGAYVGFLKHGAARSIYLKATHPSLSWARLPGVLSRLKAVDRLQLSPEGGYALSDLKRLTQHLLRGGERVFSLALHSTSMCPGHTPSVQTEQDLAAFLATLRGYFEYFLNAVGGVASTPLEVRRLLLGS